MKQIGNKFRSLLGETVTYLYRYVSMINDCVNKCLFTWCHSFLWAFYFFNFVSACYDPCAKSGTGDTMVSKTT